MKLFCLLLLTLTPFRPQMAEPKLKPPTLLPCIAQRSVAAEIQCERNADLELLKSIQNVPDCQVSDAVNQWFIRLMGYVPPTRPKFCGGLK